MSQKRIGIVPGANMVPGLPSPEAVSSIESAEEMGIPGAWLVTAHTDDGHSGQDPLTLFGAAALRTSRILLGTCIVPTYLRHPVIMAQQVASLAQLAPGRFRLGVGPAHRPTMVPTFGVDFSTPLGHLSEYLHVVKTLLSTGSVDFQGQHCVAHSRMSAPVEVPVMASALRPRSFELCGAEADGAITFQCPGAYLRDVALPAMAAGAQRAGRPVPPLIDGVQVAVHDNVDEVRAEIKQHPLPLPFYRRMFAAAGFPEALYGGNWSDAMIDAAIVIGDEARVAEKLEERFSMGPTEIIVFPRPAGRDPKASVERTTRLAARVAKSMGG